MKNRVKRMCAALCAGLMLLAGQVAGAEEKRLGDFIYVPAMTVMEGVGTINLRVRGLALTGDNDQPTEIEALAGAEFGVYVFSDGGELTPWANPLYPSEQMRIRTGEGATSFSLPQGMEFYLRQESAPQGYLFDPSELIRVDGNEIIVTNMMAGELLLCARDSLMQPVQGAVIEATAENGEVISVVTDENGEALIRCEEAAVFSVRETALPHGTFDAIRVLVNGEETEGVQAAVEPAFRTRLTFEHPASGSIELSVQLVSVDENGEEVSSPLSGVAMEILGENGQIIVTDETGSASVALLEGLYDVRFISGEEGMVLSHTQGQTLVKGGAHTKIELTAARPEGRIAAYGLGEGKIVGGSIAYINAITGEEYGPYLFDAEGIAVSDLLPAGEYRIAEIIAPENTQYAGVAYDAIDYAAEEVLLSVAPGAADELAVKLLTMEEQTYGLYVQRINDQGEIDQLPMTENTSLTICDENGVPAGMSVAEAGAVKIEALSGVYTLKMDEELALKLGVSPVSEPFRLPDDGEVISFAADSARLILMSVDENGEAIPGAAYSVLDSTGMEVVVETDEEGLGVTPLLAAGTMRIESVRTPVNHDESATLSVDAPAGSAAIVKIEHPSYGMAQISVGVQTVSERGTLATLPLSGIGVNISSVEADGHTLVDTGVIVQSDAQGLIAIQLPSGVYAARINADTLPEGYTEGESVIFEVSNTIATDVKLLCMDALGGVRVALVGGKLTDEELAQVRFELSDENGRTYDLTMMGGEFFAVGLQAGSYLLRQTQIPQGYALAKDGMVTVLGGSVAQVSVALEEYAVLSVNKTGITFNDRMQTYLVPLSGEYGVYVSEDGEMKPYPSEEAQMTVWANVTPEQIAQGRMGTLRLPADIDGTTYYIKELGSAAGFAKDEDYHEATLIAGESLQVLCTVSSDRGFFAFSQLDIATGEHVSGGEYELIDHLSGESVLRFALDGESYRNAMAVPVGEYILRQLSAGEGYAMSEPAQCTVIIEPYLTHGGMVTQAQMYSTRIPQDAGIHAIGDVYAAEQEGLTLVMIEGSALDMGETLRVPQMTVRISSEEGERTDVASVILSGASDAMGGKYAARVEYCLQGGGWQPSDARVAMDLTTPVCIGLDDVEDDISAIRITYIDAVTGEERINSGFNPGQISLNTEVSATGKAQMLAEVQFAGESVYSKQFLGERFTLSRSERHELRFAAQGSGEFDTVSAGRDGRITGVVFFDENADGVMSAGEQARYAGLMVSLMTPSMEVVATCRSDGNGRYEFNGISGGEYLLQFEAGERLVFSSGEGYSAHLISGIEDKQYGVSAALRFDGDHTNYVVNAGCIYAAHASGTLKEKTVEGLRGYVGLNVELTPAEGMDEEPTVVMTDSDGMFRFTRILPGMYDMRIELPEDSLCLQAQDGVISQRVTVKQGEELELGEYVITSKSSVSGRVYVDEDGDGVFTQGAQAASGVQVSLLKHADGHSEAVAQTITDEFGGYTFDNLFDGEYSVLFELGEGWTFTRFGQDSQVYGAVSSSGSTKSFALLPDTQMTNVNAGITRPVSLEVFVFADEHADGNKGVYDEGLAGVTVSLIRQENSSDAEHVTLTSGKDGLLLFEGLAPGEYVIAYQMPGTYRATKQLTDSVYPTSCVPQTTLSAGRSEPFTLSMNGNNARRYIGAMLSGQISGTVYYDNDADARIGDEEPAYEGMLVELLGSDGVVLDTRVSDTQGQYAFEGLAPGRYSVRFNAQEECGFSGSERSMTRGGVQRSDEPVSTTRSLSITAGGKLTTVHAGVVRLASVEGMLFVDNDADGVAADTEARFAGVSVHLMNGGARSILMSTVTDENGMFRFDRVTPGTYLIRVDAPEGYVFSGAMQGSPLELGEIRDGRGYSAAFELLGGAQAQGIGYGLLTQGAISGRVWIDKDYDGQIGDAEEGMRGALVKLSNLNGEVVATKTTLRSGEFAFDGLMPGEYTLSVSLEEGYVFTSGGADSLMDRIDAQSASLYLGMLGMGETLANVTIGAIKPASVSGMVWLDENNDGRRFDGDAGVSGTEVTLTMLSGTDAGKTYTAVTQENGLYRFDCVMPGEAQLSFMLEDGFAFAKNASGAKRVSCVPMTDGLFAQSGVFSIASGQMIAEMDAGALPVGSVNGRVWEDAVYNGIADSDENGVAGVKVLLMNAESGDEVSSALTDENGGYAIGFVRPGRYALAFELPDGMIFTCEGSSEIAMVDASKAQTAVFDMALRENRENVLVGAIDPAGISGTIAVDWNENGACDGDEPGLSGAIVTVMQGGTVLTSAKTDEAGRYSFDALRPGSYRIRVALPENALFSAGAQLALASANAQEGETGEYILGMGQWAQIAPIPAVLTASVSGRAWMDSDTDGVMDPQEAPMTDVSVQLLDQTGGLVEETRMDENGEYRFGLLRSGTYALRFVLGDGVLFADKTGEPGGSCVDPVQGNMALSDMFALSQESVLEGMNVGGILPGSIGDTVFMDVNGNGLQDYREPLISGVSIELMNVKDDGTLVLAKQTVSDEYGYYAFDDLRPGSYVVRVLLSAGEALTQRVDAPLGEIDSDVNPESGETDVISLVSGQRIRNIDIGFTDK